MPDIRAHRLALQLVEQAARIMGAPRLIPISFAHIDACFYTGQSHVDFVRFLLEHGATLSVPAWTNNSVASPDDGGLRPERTDPEMVRGAHELMELYARLGCKPTWTCAPYQLAGGPKFGDHIAVGESNAVAYYNSAVGARTNKYGDYLDVACAITGLAPFAGLHTDEGRVADIHFSCPSIPEKWKRQDIFFHLLGHLVGRKAGRRIPVVSDLPKETTADQLKALCAASAASGGVELLHVVGVTPEAPTLQAVFRMGEVSEVTTDDLRAAHHELSNFNEGSLDAVALGTPHFSLSEFAELVKLLDGRKVKAATYISTSRGIREMLVAKGWLKLLQEAGVIIPVDVCTYYSPKIQGLKGRVMTNAAKWAYYAPGMLGVAVCFGGLKECVESAVQGHVWRDPDLWSKP
ncbi:MAG: aconitase X catalytic domain-containing protein [Hyphomicrobiales bacterium]|nr:aconitase X catalytic domain-containing protein [Hyphomicrobiales bacterium]